ncbi:MAG: GIY-YIG nuclease family protein [bacterium]
MANHGRLHPYWTRPSNRNRGRAAQRRDLPVNYPSLSVAMGNEDFTARKWLNLEWTEFHTFDNWQPPNIPGVYRIKKGSDLLYFGQSTNLRSRIRSHGHDSRFTHAHISVHEMPEAASHQLKERETDLIGAYFSLTGLPPAHQYRNK